MTVGSRIKALRLQNGLTLRELAVRVGATASTIRKWEEGEIRTLKASNLQKIADVLGTTPGYLMGWREQIVSADGIDPLPATKQVPVVGKIACGEPILAEQSIEGYVSIDAQAQVDFALQCKGYSMIGARIYDGDTVFIRQQSQVDNGEIAAVLIDDEATLKRVYLYPDRIELRAENPAFPPIVYEGEDRSKVRILGKAILLLGRIS